MIENKKDIGTGDLVLSLYSTIQLGFALVHKPDANEMYTYCKVFFIYSIINFNPNEVHLVSYL